MNKDRKIYGIDISKAVFDLYNDTTGHLEFENDIKDLFFNSVLSSSFF